MDTPRFLPWEGDVGTVKSGRTWRRRCWRKRYAPAIRNSAPPAQYQKRSRKFVASTLSKYHVSGDNRNSAMIPHITTTQAWPKASIYSFCKNAALLLAARHICLAQRCLSPRILDSRPLRLRRSAFSRSSPPPQHSVFCQTFGERGRLFHQRHQYGSLLSHVFLLNWFPTSLRSLAFIVSHGVGSLRRIVSNVSHAYGASTEI